MTGGDDDVAGFWTRARAATALDGAVPPAWAFGDSPDMADELLALVLDGTKTATAGALWHHEADGEPVPAAGDLSIVLDGRGVPRCLIRTTAVRIVAFDEVDEAFAYDEGEGDRTLAWWRDAHERFFRRTLPAGYEFARDMPVVCERFRVAWAPPPDA